MNNAKYTHKTRDGRLARIIASDIKHEKFPVMALVLTDDNSELAVSYKIDLTCPGIHNLDLFERNVWDDVPVDTKIFVKDFEDNEWIPRHFSHFENGYVMTFVNGGTSFTCTQDETTSWRFAKLAD